MFGLAWSARLPQKDYSSCSGCNLCLLVCPVWRRTHDFALTPHGRVKALQHGATALELAESVQSCSMCAACEPVCPEDIGLLAMTMDLRRQLPRPAVVEDLCTRMEAQAGRAPLPHPGATRALLPGQALRARAGTLERTASLLGSASPIRLADDDGADIALALEAGIAIAPQRMMQFLRPLRGLKRIIVADGLLLRHLRALLPGSMLVGLGEALSRLPAVRAALRPTDLYVIEARAYHADYQRLVKYYDTLRAAVPCSFNLDLQRIAIPTTARTPAQRCGQEAIDDGVQLRWILQGRKVARIVVESMEDRAAFAQHGNTPVVHLADLADDGRSSE